MNKEKVYEIGQAYIRLDFKAGEDFKKSFEEYLLYKGKLYANEIYQKELLLDGFYFTTELEDGSLKARLKVFGKIAIASLITYGGLRTAVDYLIKDAQTFTEYIARDIASEPSIGRQSIGRIERRKIKRLYSDIAKLNRDKNNLTENQQQKLIDKIQKNFEDLIHELDDDEVLEIQQDLIRKKTPIPRRNKDFFLRGYLVREEEVSLIPEEKIKPPLQLPPRQE